MRKTLYTMRIDDYAPEMCAITYPLLKLWARKCGAEFYEINTRKFPDWPIPYETFQIYDLMAERDDDWAIWIDADALVHPETPDWTWYLPTDTCAQNGSDPAPIRWQLDEYFRRDGRRISSCNWHAAVPRDCRDFFRPGKLTLEEVCSRIFATVEEIKGTCQGPHLVSDYTVSRNIARFGLKYTTFARITDEHMPGAGPFYNHLYTVPDAHKIDQHLLTLNSWFGGMRYAQRFMGWDDATNTWMLKRFAEAQGRAEASMEMEEIKKQLVECKEQSIRAAAVAFVQNTLKQNGGQLPAAVMSKLIEDYTILQIAK